MLQAFYSAALPTIETIYTTASSRAISAESLLSDAVIERSMSTCSASVLGGDLDVCVDADKRETADSCSLGASGG